MIEISTDMVLVLLSASAFFGVFALWALEKLISDYMHEINQWKNVTEAFVEACEIDGFGHVRDAHSGDLTKAMEMYKEVKNA